MRVGCVCVSILLAVPVAAQEPGSGPTIQVVGTGKTSTPPDTAQIDYWVTGEGKTADAAAQALATKQTAIAAGLSGLLRGKTMLTGGNVIMIEARNPLCRDAGGYDNRPRLSEGDCAVTGYVATLQGHVRTDRVDKAATAIGLAGRLGARDARLQAFVLADDTAARRAATAAAIVDARTQAQGLADAAGTKLGPVLIIRDQVNRQYDDIVVSGSQRAAPPPAPAPLPPIPIEINPRPIETRAQVYVTYALQN